jgi:DNA transposition AAA+ family ATPase
MGAHADEIELANSHPAPPTAKVLAAANAYLTRADLSHAEFADQIGYGVSTIHMFLAGRYHARDDKYLRAAVWDYMQRSPLDVQARSKGVLFETENYHHILRYFKRATLNGEWVLLYGPPGTQKSFVLDHLICQLHREKKQLAGYVYASADMRPLPLLKRIGRALGVPVRAQTKERLVNTIVTSFARMEQVPAIVIDEAQHLDVTCLEIVRELHDLSGCGIVLAGSHMLLQGFMRADRKGHLEQLLSRIDHRDELPGLREDEVRKIAEREWGKKLGEKFIGKLVEQCRVEDIFASKEMRSYLSVRRLVKAIAQYKSEKEEAA